MLQPQALVSPALSPDFDEQYRSFPPAKLGVLASGSGTNFEALIQAIADGDLRAEIPVVIYNNPGAKVAARAARWGIPAVLLDHRNYVSREAFDYEVVQTLKRHQVDWAIMAGWMRRVTTVFIDAFPQRAINIHPSILPSFPGIRAIEQALEAKVKVAGCTVHLVDLEVDSGPILMQAVVPILDNDTPETLHARVQAQEHAIFPKAIGLAIAQGHKSPTP
ncbi:MAG: phosphoribosylglycinamide formyltransferase [Cyanobacteria bacterium P01_C01_bin.89]